MSDFNNGGGGGGYGGGGGGGYQRGGGYGGGSGGYGGGGGGFQKKPFVPKNDGTKEQLELIDKKLDAFFILAREIKSLISGKPVETSAVIAPGVSISTGKSFCIATLSCELPQHLTDRYIQLASDLNASGVVYRFTGALAVDKHLMERIDARKAYLPWQGYNQLKILPAINPKPETKDTHIAKDPGWETLKDFIKTVTLSSLAMLDGNVGELPVSFILTNDWGNTQEGRDIANHRDADRVLRMGRDLGIPIYNIDSPDFSLSKCLS